MTETGADGGQERVSRVVTGLGVAALLVLACGIGGYVYVQDAAGAAASADLRSTATTQADSVGNWQSQLSAQARLLSAASPVENGDEERIKRYLSATSERLPGTVVAVHYVDTRDRPHVVTASTDDSVSGRTVAGVESDWEPVLQRAMAPETNDTAVFHTASSHDRDGGRGMTFGSPVPGRDGVVLVVGSIPLPETRPVSGTAVFDAEREVVFAADADGNSVGDDATDAGLTQARDGRVTTTAAGGRLLAYAPVPGTSWVLVSAAERSSLAPTATRAGHALWLLTALSLLSLGVLAVVYRRQTTEPLDRLRRRVRAMGDGDLNVDFSTDREGEVGALYDALADVQTELRAQIREAREAEEVAEQSKQQLQRQNQRLDEFASTLSHDLRNPLTVARGHVELLSTRLSDAESAGLDTADHWTHVEKLEGSHDRIESIIDDVLTLTREGESVDETEQVSLEDAAQEAWANVDSGDATIEITGSRPIEADRDRLLRAFENLFRNAVDHVGDDVTVELGTLRDGFYVADDGPGIPFEEVDDIFEYGHTTSDGGTGLGLSIVRTIAEAHGWRLYVDTTYEDGAMFVFADVFDRGTAASEETAIERGETDD
ncbi:ATP-binding protein [Haloarcula marina]|uniref:ATP-binding protein n=1 Tax=Haloarcula marina TaxID=2961574 RepID=UPI0020B88B96|nr:ATP-binding protein [Halomicroarcula marina]